MIAITGATGAIGSRVAALLAAQDHPLRLLVREASHAARLHAEVAVFAGYTDGERARASLTGCDTLTAVSGRDVRYKPETEDEAYASRRHYGAPDFEVRGWVTSYQAIASGELRPVADTVERVTARAPQSFQSFLHAEPGSWAHLADSDPS